MIIKKLKMCYRILFKNGLYLNDYDNVKLSHYWATRMKALADVRIYYIQRRKEMDDQKQCREIYMINGFLNKLAEIEKTQSLVLAYTDDYEKARADKSIILEVVQKREINKRI